MSQATKTHPCGTMPLGLVVAVKVNAYDFTDDEIAIAELKATSAATRAAADYLKGVLAARKLGPTLPEAA